MSKLFVFGLGYTGTFVAHAFRERGWSVQGTVRSEQKLASLAATDVDPIRFDDRRAVEAALAQATHLLVSIPPAAQGDPVLSAYAQALNEDAPTLRWIAYLSTIGVYGNHNGNWVDEETPASTLSERAAARIQAERAWAAFASRRELALDIFRLAGIYGPGRNPLERLREGEARRIVKAGQVFNRIHVEDIVQTVVAAIAQSPFPGARIFNVTDDEPAPSEDVILHAAELLGVPPPPPIPFEAAKLSIKAEAFYRDNRRVRNGKIKRELGVMLRYPSFREGLLALKNRP